MIVSLELMKKEDAFMIDENSQNMPSGSHLLAQLRLRNFFAKHILEIVNHQFAQDPHYPEFERLLKKQNNFEVVNCLYIIADQYRNHPTLLTELMKILTKKVG